MLYYSNTILETDEAINSLTTVEYNETFKDLCIFKLEKKTVR